MTVDKLYQRPLNSPIEPFTFSEEVACVFDDMASRSIPFYQQVQSQIVELTRRLFQRGTRVYDLGCSTGTTLVLLSEAFEKAGIQDYQLWGIDSSPAMCERAQRKLEASRNVQVKVGDIREEEFENPSVVILNYTLQFLPLTDRIRLIQKIHAALYPGGALIISDKTRCEDPDLGKLFTDTYHNFKKSNGYSQLEITQKRQALKNVLLPYSLTEEKELLIKGGFKVVELFHNWFNFASFICLKEI